MTSIELISKHNQLDVIVQYGLVTASVIAINHTIKLNYTRLFQLLEQ
ncbi:hypothetical protein [Bacillus sp. FSL K6-3431]